ncbi:MAG: hypothetical protein ABH862_03430, partial [Candidatus Omnitrophota bacterium]
MDDQQTNGSIMLWKDRNIRLIRIISIILSLIFLEQQTGWAQGGRPVWAQAKPVFVSPQDKFQPTKYEIPYDLAKTQEVVINGGDEVIFNIQDAHSSLSAQYSIAKLLETLVEDYDLELIALEGASGYIDTSLLGTFPDKRIRRDTASFLMREGRMSAGEFFAITSDDKNLSLYGIEDDALYRENVNSFRGLADDRAEKTANLTALLEQLDLLAVKMWTKELAEFNRDSYEHRERKLSFSAYWNRAGELTEQHKIDISKYPEISKLLSSMELEKTIDFTKANTERKQLIDEISKGQDKNVLEILVLKSLAFKQNKISQADYHEYLVTLAENEGIAADQYENLIMFTKYVTLYESIELMGLYREIKVLEDEIREKMYRTDREREIFEMIRMTQLIKQLYSMELDNTESDHIIDHKDEFSAEKYAAFIKENSREYGTEITAGYDLGDIESGI